jgi:hypothetical protein
MTTTYTAEPAWIKHKPAWMIYAFKPQPKRPFLLAKCPLFYTRDEAKALHILKLIQENPNDK